MKKSLSILILLLITVTGLAQTQQGYVKTKGRMINGKYVPGSGLVGATVIVKGRSSLTVQNKTGLFSFVIPAQQFTVLSVKKKGNEIIDNDFSEFEKAGVIPEKRKEDVERIRQLLTE